MVKWGTIILERTTAPHWGSQKCRQSLGAVHKFKDVRSGTEPKPCPKQGS